MMNKLMQGHKDGIVSLVSETMAALWQSWHDNFEPSVTFEEEGRAHGEDCFNVRVAIEAAAGRSFQCVDVCILCMYYLSASRRRRDK